ncbi:MAG TPA: hypothetical protein VGA87_08675, partial [Pyrinomonadaceae bacterium]
MNLRTTIRPLVFTLSLIAVTTLAGSSVRQAAASDPGGGDWPMWGGTPDRNMVSNMKGIPVSWDVQKKTNV